VYSVEFSRISIHETYLHIFTYETYEETMAGVGDENKPRGSFEDAMDVEVGA
jgi:hypothetical protein